MNLFFRLLVCWTIFGLTVFEVRERDGGRDGGKGRGRGSGRGRGRGRRRVIGRGGEWERDRILPC